MTYDTLRNGIVGRLTALGLAESNEVFNFKDASSSEYGNTFILRSLSGKLNEESDDINRRFDDAQDWEIQVAFERSSQNDLVQRDIANRKREEIIKDLDNPTNTMSFVKTLRYSDWSIEELDNYFLLKINLRVVDRLTY